MISQNTIKHLKSKIGENLFKKVVTYRVKSFHFKMSKVILINTLHKTQKVIFFIIFYLIKSRCIN